MAKPTQEPSDRIWLLEQEFHRPGGYYERSEIVVRDEELAKELQGAWTITEYERVKKDG